MKTSRTQKSKRQKPSDLINNAALRQKKPLSPAWTRVLWCAFTYSLRDQMRVSLFVHNFNDDGRTRSNQLTTKGNSHLAPLTAGQKLLSPNLLWRTFESNLQKRPVRTWVRASEWCFGCTCVWSKNEREKWRAIKLGKYHSLVSKRTRSQMTERIQSQFCMFEIGNWCSINSFILPITWWAHRINSL